MRRSAKYFTHLTMMHDAFMPQVIFVSRTIEINNSHYCTILVYRIVTCNCICRCYYMLITSKGNNIAHTSIGISVRGTQDICTLFILSNSTYVLDTPSHQMNKGINTFDSAFKVMR